MLRDPPGPLALWGMSPSRSTDEFDPVRSIVRGFDAPDDDLLLDEQDAAEAPADRSDTAASDLPPAAARPPFFTPAIPGPPAAAVPLPEPPTVVLEPTLEHDGAAQRPDLHRTPRGRVVAPGPGAVAAAVRERIGDRRPRGRTIAILLAGLIALVLLAGRPSAPSSPAPAPAPRAQTPEPGRTTARLTSPKRATSTRRAARRGRPRRVRVVRRTVVVTRPAPAARRPLAPHEPAPTPRPAVAPMAPAPVAAAPAPVPSGPGAPSFTDEFTP